MSSPQSNSTLIITVVGEAVRAMMTYWRHHMALSFALAVPVVVLAAIGFFDPLVTMLPRESGEAASIPPGGLLRVLSFLALTLMITGAYATGWWIAVSGGAAGPANLLAPFAAHYSLVLTKMAILGVLLAGAIVVLSIVGALAMLLLSPFVRAIGGQAAVSFLISVAVQLALLGVGMRLATALPPAAWGENIPFQAAWEATRGQTPVLMMIALVLALPALMASLLATQLFAVTAGANTWLTMLAGILISPINFLAHALVLAAVAAFFRRCRETGRL